jgi:hypothetical protein
MGTQITIPLGAYESSGFREPNRRALLEPEGIEREKSKRYPQNYQLNWAAKCHFCKLTPLCLGLNTILRLDCDTFILRLCGCWKYLDGLDLCDNGLL